MKPKQLEQLLLLEQSGELTDKQRRELEARLAASADARRLREELRRFAAALPVPAVQPAPGAAARIATRLRQPAKPSFTLLPAWKPALAAAAALGLLLGVRTFRPDPNPGADDSAVASAPAQEEEWFDPLEAEFNELESLIAAISSDGTLEITEL